MDLPPQLPAQVEGVEYTPEAVESVRLALIEIRNAALDQASFEIAVALSHAIVYLSHYRDAMGSIGRAFEDIERRP